MSEEPPGGTPQDPSGGGDDNDDGVESQIDEYAYARLNPGMLQAQARADAERQRMVLHQLASGSATPHQSGKKGARKAHSKVLHSGAHAGGASVGAGLSTAMLSRGRPTQNASNAACHRCCSSKVCTPCQSLKKCMQPLVMLPENNFLK